MGEGIVLKEKIGFSQDLSFPRDALRPLIEIKNRG